MDSEFLESVKKFISNNYEKCGKFCEILKMNIWSIKILNLAILYSMSELPIPSRAVQVLNVCVCRCAICWSD
jgi:hypothetical protein